MPTMYDQNTWSSSSRWSFADAIALSFSSSSTCSATKRKNASQNMISLRCFVCGVVSIFYLILVWYAVRCSQSDWIDRAKFLRLNLALASRPFFCVPPTVELEFSGSSHPTAIHLAIASEMLKLEIESSVPWNWILCVTPFTFLLEFVYDNSVNGGYGQIQFLTPDFDFQLHSTDERPPE